MVEREKRFLQLSYDDLVAFRKSAGEDIAELERQTDAITPLESSRREENLQDLLDWYHRYYDVLAGEESEAEKEGAHEVEAGRLGDIIQAETTLALELKEKVKAFADEQRRLVTVLERRRLLQAQFDDIQAQLATLRKTQSEGQLTGNDKERRHRLHRDLKVVQTELQSLPVVDEDLVRHYTVLMEQGRWESEWLSLTEEEYPALQDVALLVSSNDPRDIRALSQAYQRLANVYDRQIGRLNRMMDGLERQRSKVLPAGTLREIDRSEDLKDLYDRLIHRMDARTRDLRVRIGACDAEMAQLTRERATVE